MSDPGDLLLVGEIGKPHGLGGEVYVIEISDDPRRFAPGSSLTHADGRTLQVEGARRHRDRLLVKFAGVEDREGAETLRGALYVKASERRDLEPDEYWESDLVGCELVDEQKTSFGRVSDVLTNRAQPLLVIETPDGPRYVPLVKEIVRSVDPGERKIVIDPPAGLLD